MNWSWLSDTTSLRWRHNDHAGVSNHQPHGCSLNRLFKRKSKKTPLKFRVTDLCAGNSLGPENSPHKRTVTRKMFPFDDVIMWPHRSGSILARVTWVMVYCFTVPCVNLINKFASHINTEHKLEGWSFALRDASICGIYRFFFWETSLLIA